MLPRRNIGIDILRGFCILFVILLHLNIQVNFKETLLGDLLPKRWYSLFFWSGFYGVIIFFTLSGYLITSSAIKKWGTLTDIKIKDFFIMRFSRIAPLLILLLIVLSTLHIAKIPGFIINEEKTSLIRVVFAALTFHINWLEIQVGYLPANWDVLWSISIEEIFYLTFPILCLLARKEWHFVALILVFLIISPWARTGMFPDNELGDRNHLAYLDAIAFGCITAIIAHRVKISKKIINILMILGCCFIILIMFYKGFVYRSGLTDIGLNITLLSLGVSLLVLWLHYKEKTNTQKDFWVLKGIKKMGELSYEMYLTHMFVVIVFVKIYKEAALSKEWIYVLYAVVIFISFLLAKFLHRWVTEPMNQRIRLRYIKNKV